MTVYSMTGYASAQSDADAPHAEAPAAHRLGLEIRAVNSRFLDLSFRLPDELRAFEPALREQITARLKRGKVELRAFVEGTDAGSLPDPSPKLLQRLGTLQDTVRAWLPDAAPLSVAEALRLGAQEPAGHTDWNATLPALTKQALAALLEARQREGARLAVLLHERVAGLRTLAQQAGPLVPQAVEQQRQRFLGRWREALASAESTIPPQTTQDRALTEAAAFAIRIDIAEELGRLAAHLDEIDRLLKKGGEIGKRLDFLIQELHREANTLGAKSAVLELTRIAVDMKVLIEQMREQVQNIE